MVNKKKKEQERSHIPFRLNLLFFIIFLLFVSLVIRTGYLQIIKGEDFKAEVARTESTIIRKNVARGEIVDKNLSYVVKNEAKNIIEYARGANSIHSMAQVASNLARLIDIPHTTPFEEDRSDLSIRDMKDYFYAQNQEKVTERVREHLAEHDIKASDFSYSNELELITEAELLQLDDHELKAAAIFTKMNSAYALSTAIVKNEDVTTEEIARVNEYAFMLPGISTQTDWDRVYPEGEVLRSVLGRVSNQEQGVPEETFNEYLARGYSRNDRVGLSQIEAQYEDVLRGSKSRSVVETSNQGDILNQEVIHPGDKGNNLVLTIDMDFQEKVNQIVREAFDNRTGLSNSAYAVAINPKNGDILAMSGIRQNENGEIVDGTLDTIQSAYEMGSSVKAATVLMGYMDGVISLENNTMIDTRLRFRGDTNISSVFNRFGRVSVNDITALKYSSNVYMSHIAMRMGGYYNYQQDMPVPIRPVETTEKMRTYYRQFGLGSPTGIDLPNESVGQSSIPDTPGKAMFLAFGQFDTYTPMQLAQYSSTIANGGIRFAPRLVSEIRRNDPDTGEIGGLVQNIEPKIMNTIDVSDEIMGRVQTGLYEVVNGGYGPPDRIFADAPYVAAGKTGTAEANYWGGRGNPQNGTKVTNTTFIGYAPYDDPEIAIAVVLPYLPLSNYGTTNVEMSRQIFDAYFEVGQFASEQPEDSEETEELEDVE